MKRIVTIQDISCVGKCSITVALPIISAMGVECAILPTAVLSTHTQFQGFTVKDLQDQIEPISAHWQKEKFHFDAIYTGYLASAGQIELVKNFFEAFGASDTLRFVDPAMADDGRLYAGFDAAFPKAMASLCGVADVIVPNLTEACLMTGTEYRTDYDDAYVEALLKKLAALGTRRAVVLTGVTTVPGKTGVTGMDVATGQIFGFSHDRHRFVLHVGSQSFVIDSFSRMGQEGFFFVFVFGAQYFGIAVGVFVQRDLRAAHVPALREQAQLATAHILVGAFLEPGPPALRGGREAHQRGAQRNHHSLHVFFLSLGILKIRLTNCRSRP